MYLIKIRMKKAICISRDSLEDKGKQLYGPDFELGPCRGKTDAIRVALTHRLRDYVKFVRYTSDGEAVECKVLAVPVKDVPRDTVHVQINVQERRKDSVTYTAEVCTVRYTPESGLTVEEGEYSYIYSDIIRDIDAETLCKVGKSFMFESDVRKLFADLTDKHTLKFWHGGTYVCLSNEAYVEVQRAATLLNSLSYDFTLQTITIDNSDENRRSVAVELGESVFAKAFDELTVRACRAGANLERLEQEYSDLLEKIADVEAWLGCPVDCADSQESFELALSELAAKETA